MANQVGRNQTLSPRWDGVDFVRYWNAPDLEGLELLKARFDTFAFSPHAHTGYALGVIQQGVERFDLDGARHRAPCGRIVLVNPGQVHTGQADDDQGWAYRMFYPPARLLGRALEEMGGRGLPRFKRAVVDDPTLANQLTRLHTVLENPSQPLERQSAWATVAARLISRHAEQRPGGPPGGRENRAVAQIRNFLEDNFQQPVSLGQLTGLTGLSKYHLIRVFHRVHGLPPHAYLNHVRLVRAREMISKGESLVQAALACGFADQAHLTRRSKSSWGITPGRYAKAISFNN